MWIRWIELAASIWLITAPFALGYTGAPYWNDVLIGLLAAVVTLIGWREYRLWWAVVPFGVWLLMAPFLLGYVDVRPALWNDLVIGTVLVAAGWIWRGSAGRRRALRNRAR